MVRLYKDKIEEYRSRVLKWLITEQDINDFKQLKKELNNIIKALLEDVTQPYDESRAHIDYER